MKLTIQGKCIPIFEFAKRYELDWIILESVETLSLKFVIDVFEKFNEKGFRGI